MTEVDRPSAPISADPLQAGKDALGRRAWTEAFDLLSEADRDGTLSGADLEALALSAFFAARADVEVGIKERAFKAYEADGDMLRAAYLALDVAREYGYAGKRSIASGWTRRAERILGSDGETYAHGYLAIIRSEAAAAGGDIDRALAEAERAVEIGDRAADRDLTAFALSNLGALKIANGATSDGLALMEEASIAAVNGELSPFATGVAACRMISACRDMTDYRRASEWIEATERYCDRQSLAGFPGVCRIHRAEITAVGGAWERAESELERATTELGAYNAGPPQADGFYAIGEIRRLKGDFAGAEAALREAHARGRTPQPALALIQLAEGKVRAAATAIDGAVREASWDRWARARLLPAQVEIAIAAGDVATARAAVDELSTVVGTYPSPALDAGRQTTLGRVLLAEGDAAGSVREARAAIRGWLDVGSPFEVARARMVLARGLAGLQDDDAAVLEYRAAVEEFRRLGAAVDLEDGERELRALEDRRSGPVTIHKTFMFTDIVGSTNLAEALGDQAWERLLQWHDSTLRRIVVDGGGEIVNSTGDGFFAVFDTASAGVAGAAAIQRALADHRMATGFAISVRIGLHTAEANRRGSDYSGKAVHVAARVAALAGSGEILATVETLEEADGVATSAPRDTQVKGVTEPIRISAVTWD